MDALLKSGIDAFAPVKIHKLEGAGLQWKQFSFQEIEFSYDNIHVSLDTVHIDLSFQNKSLTSLPLIDRLSIDKFSLSTKEEDPVTKASMGTPLKQRKKNTAFKIGDYRPETLYKQLNTIDIHIKTLELHQPSILKTPVILSNFRLEKAGQDAGELRLAADVKEPKSGKKLSLELFIYHQKHLENYSLNILFNNLNKASLSIDFKFQEAEQAKQLNYSSASLDIHFKANADQGINEILKNYISGMESFELQELQTDTNLFIQISEHIDIEHIEAAIIESKLKTKSHAHAYLNNQLFKEIIFDAQLQAKGQKDEDGNLLHNFSLAKQRIFTLIPDKSHEYYNGNDSLDFLSRFPIELDILDNSTWQLDKTTLKASPALSISWSEAGNNVYLNTQLEKLELDFSSAKLHSKLSYQLTGRWNRYFSSEHKGNLAIESLPDTNEHTLTAQLYDTRLASNIELFLKNKQKQYSGNVEISTPDISKGSQHINQALGYWDRDFKLLSGSLALTGNFNAQENTEGEYDITYTLNTEADITKMDYDGYIFRKLESDTMFKGHNSTLVSNGSFPIRIQEIDTGLILNNFEIFAQLDMNLDKESRILFSNLSAQVLGGTLTAEPFTLFLPQTPDNKPQRYHSHFALWLDNIQLSQMLALANNPEIQGEGLLEGKLPVYIDEELSLIKQGKLNNKNHGYIRYVPDQQSRASLAQNPQMALLINVLTHLNYDELSADVNLDANGKMKLNGSIKGVNPDFKGGYPIHFNPSIDLDFTDMLRSLQISDSIDKTIRSRMNEKKLD